MVNKDKETEQIIENLTQNQRGCLLEALRRYVRFHYGKDLVTAWVGLGTKTDYKSVNGKFMTMVHGHEPRANGWWKLTERGHAIVDYWLRIHGQNIKTFIFQQTGDKID